ncbi:hypothetical protein [Nocardia pseudovaccinii]|uniref:hypothetical protein n=1 Tax=Nocardia pseudovaccinii TaxID=189540 RepID=UPI0007A38F8D|nr:hypothetical protein [Nocardia pseudovaccinii]
MGQFCRAVFLDADHKLIGYLEPKIRFLKRAWIGDDFVQGVERLLTVPTRVVWAGPQVGKQTSLYDKAASVAPLVAPQNGFIGRYILNHDKRTYVDKATVRHGADRHRIHPLPMLTAEGADCAGGAAALVGTWSGDRISMSATVPTGFALLEYDMVAN